MVEKNLEDLSALEHKVRKFELRARDAEARLRIVEAEVAIATQRQKLTEARKGA